MLSHIYFHEESHTIQRLRWAENTENEGGHYLYFSGAWLYEYRTEFPPVPDLNSLDAPEGSLANFNDARKVDYDITGKNIYTKKYMVIEKGKLREKFAYVQDHFSYYNPYGALLFSEKHELGIREIVYYLYEKNYEGREVNYLSQMIILRVPRVKVQLDGGEGYAGHHYYVFSQKIKSDGWNEFFALGAQLEHKVKSAYWEVRTWGAVNDSSEEGHKMNKRREDLKGDLAGQIFNNALQKVEDLALKNEQNAVIASLIAIVVIIALVVLGVISFGTIAVVILTVLLIAALITAAVLLIKDAVEGREYGDNEETGEQSAGRKATIRLLAYFFDSLGLLLKWRFLYREWFLICFEILMKRWLVCCVWFIGVIEASLGMEEGYIMRQIQRVFRDGDTEGMSEVEKALYIIVGIITLAGIVTWIEDQIVKRSYEESRALKKKTLKAEQVEEHKLLIKGVKGLFNTDHIDFGKVAGTLFTILTLQSIGLLAKILKALRHVLKALIKIIKAAVKAGGVSWLVAIGAAIAFAAVAVVYVPFLVFQFLKNVLQELMQLPLLILKVLFKVFKKVASFLAKKLGKLFKAVGNFIAKAILRLWEKIVHKFGGTSKALENFAKFKDILHQIGNAKLLYRLQTLTGRNLLTNKFAQRLGRFLHQVGNLGAKFKSLFGEQQYAVFKTTDAQGNAVDFYRAVPPVQPGGASGFLQTLEEGGYFARAIQGVEGKFSEWQDKWNRSDLSKKLSIRSSVEHRALKNALSDAQASLDASLLSNPDAGVAFRVEQARKGNTKAERTVNLKADVGGGQKEFQVEFTAAPGNLRAAMHQNGIALVLSGGWLGHAGHLGHSGMDKATNVDQWNKDNFSSRRTERFQRAHQHLMNGTDPSRLSSEERFYLNTVKDMVLSDKIFQARTAGDNWGDNRVLSETAQRQLVRKEIEQARTNRDADKMGELLNEAKQGLTQEIGQGERVERVLEKLLTEDTQHLYEQWKTQDAPKTEAQQKLEDSSVDVADIQEGPLAETDLTTTVAFDEIQGIPLTDIPQDATVSPAVIETGPEMPTLLPQDTPLLPVQEVAVPPQVELRGQIIDQIQSEATSFGVPTAPIQETVALATLDPTLALQGTTPPVLTAPSSVPVETHSVSETSRRGSLIDDVDASVSTFTEGVTKPQNLLTSNELEGIRQELAVEPLPIELGQSSVNTTQIQPPVSTAEVVTVQDLSGITASSGFEGARRGSLIDDVDASVSTFTEGVTKPQNLLTSNEVQRIRQELAVESPPVDAETLPVNNTINGQVLVDLPQSSPLQEARPLAVATSEVPRGIVEPTLSLEGETSPTVLKSLSSVDDVQGFSLKDISQETTLPPVTVASVPEMPDFLVPQETTVLPVTDAVVLPQANAPPVGAAQSGGDPLGIPTTVVDSGLSTPLIREGSVEPIGTQVAPSAQETLLSADSSVAKQTQAQIESGALKDLQKQLQSKSDLSVAEQQLLDQVNTILTQDSVVNLTIQKMSLEQGIETLKATMVDQPSEVTQKKIDALTEEKVRVEGHLNTMKELQRNPEIGG